MCAASCAQQFEQPRPTLGQRRAEGDVQHLACVDVLQEIGQALVGKRLGRGYLAEPCRDVIGNAILHVMRAKPSISRKNTGPRFNAYSAANGCWVPLKRASSDESGCATTATCFAPPLHASQRAASLSATNESG